MFNEIRYINDPGSVPGESEGSLYKPTWQTSPNVVFQENGSWRGDYLRHEAIAIRASCNIISCKELYINYSPDYLFEKALMCFDS